MKPHRLWLCTTLIVLFWAANGLAQAKTEQLGRVHFPVSCGTATQTKFDRAVALLHSFWYSEGVKAFTAVTEADPSCAMGYWGIAMSHWYPLWQPPSEAMLKKGWEAVERAKTLGGKTEREREYIAAIEVFYKDAPTLDHRTRALAYEKAMERLYARHPEDREAAVFYALALNATIVATDKTYANQLKAAEILEKVFAEQPDHPGVAHYLIHSYDYPPLASRGLDAARRYAQVAPSAPHALHMPSHIFTRLGLWQESVASNRDSAAASKEHRSVFEQLHALDYQAYGYLQGAQDREAKRILDECQALAKEDLEHFASAYAFAAIPARYALERRQWSEAAALEPRPSRVKYSEAITYFARALGAARSGDAASTRANVNKLQALHTALVDTKQDYWAGQVEIQHRTAAAWLARAEGKPEEAVRLMREATTLEDATEKHPVTPGPIFPARELLGELLLELQQPAQALQEFEASMPKEPNRFNGLYGAARAAELTGEVEKARTYYGQLVALSERGDTDRPALQQAKAFLAKK
jgi:tetratricopeptide (TPR) repeat protein